MILKYTSGRNSDKFGLIELVQTIETVESFSQKRRKFSYRISTTLVEGLYTAEIIIGLVHKTEVHFYKYQ